MVPKNIGMTVSRNTQKGNCAFIFHVKIYKISELMVTMPTLKSQQILITLQSNDLYYYSHDEWRKKVNNRMEKVL